MLAKDIKAMKTFTLKQYYMILEKNAKFLFSFFFPKGMKQTMTYNNMILEKLNFLL